MARALDVPPSAGFGEPINSLFGLVDGEFAVGFIAPDQVIPSPQQQAETLDRTGEPTEFHEDGSPQYSLFAVPDQGPTDSSDEPTSAQAPVQGVLITRQGKGFRFDYGILREPTKRLGRKLVSLAQTDEVVAAIPEDADLVAIAVDSGKMLAFPVDQIPVLAGPGQGVRMIKVSTGSQVVGMELIKTGDSLQIEIKDGEEHILKAADIPRANRSTQGKKVGESIAAIKRLSRDEGHIE